MSARDEQMGAVPDDWREVGRRKAREAKARLAEVHPIDRKQPRRLSVVPDPEPEEHE